MRSTGRAVAALLLLVATVACGDDGAPAAGDVAADDPVLADDPSGPDDGSDDLGDADEAGGDLDEAGSASGLASTGDRADVDACALLDEGFLADAVAFEFGESVWEEQPGERGECAWFNDSQILTLRVSVWTAGTYDLDDLLANPRAGTTSEAVAAPTGGVLVRDQTTGAPWQIWFGHGDDVVHVVQDVLKLDDPELAAVASEVAARLG